MRDETSESPKIHTRKIEKSKTAIQNKLAIYIEEVVIEIVEDYELLKAKKKVFPSASSPYPDMVMSRTVEEVDEMIQNTSSDDHQKSEINEEKSRSLLSDFSWLQGKRKK